MLYNGLYEQIINKGLDTELSGTDKCSQTAPIDSAEAPKALAKYVAEIVEKGLNNVKDNVLALGEKAEIIRSEASIAQSSESPRGGATGAYVEDGYLYIFQFPPPRGGRPCFCPARRHGVSISIPAPARGATAKIDKKACGFCCKFTMFALRSFEKQEQFSRKSLLSPKQQMIFLTFTAPIARCLVYGWHWRRKTCGYRSKGSPDWIGAVFPSVSILFLKELPSL